MTTAAAPTLDYDDRQDFEDADRGFIARLEPGVVKDADGRIVFDADAFRFLDGERPDTVHPSLWRQSQLTAKQGLYAVVDGIYQVRGLDLSNMTLIEGDTGVIVVDPLVSAETAAAGLGLYRANRGDRPVTGVIYTHSHVDHFGGVLGTTQGGVPIVAPAGFMQHAVSENVYAGGAMNRRAVYMYSALLDTGAEGRVGTGLGSATSAGNVGLLPPTIDVTETGQEETIDGVRFVFQLTPGTEAPAEMNFHVPERRALCMAENATHTLHNLLTLRGALVRDPHVWSSYIGEAMRRFGDGSDVVFASHHWPTWGHDRLIGFLTEQRDLYAYLHDQTLRMLNAGATGAEIAESIQVPPGLERAWNARGYYGSVSHNVKAIYQRYLGWFDGHPSSLWEHPPVESATRYVDALGGQEATVAKARAYASQGDDRFAAQLLKHAVFADPSDTDATALLADVYERLGYGAENATWRGFYLMGAAELRGGIRKNTLSLAAGLAVALSIEQLFDSIAIRLNGPRAWDEHLSIEWQFTEPEERLRTSLSNGVLIREPGIGEPADLTLTLTKLQLLDLLGGAGLDGIAHEGDPSVLRRLVALLDTPDPDFPIVTP